MAKVGDVVWDRQGNCLGVIEEILFDHFAVRVRGIGMVSCNVINFEDLGRSEPTPPQPEKEYIEVYKIT
jgi:hypothetical protein